MHYLLLHPAYGGSIPARCTTHCYIQHMGGVDLLDALLAATTSICGSRPARCTTRCYIQHMGGVYLLDALHTATTSIWGSRTARCTTHCYIQHMGGSIPARCTTRSVPDTCPVQEVVPSLALPLPRHASCAVVADVQAGF